LAAPGRIDLRPESSARGATARERDTHAGRTARAVLSCLIIMVVLLIVFG
jgi:hypothetical protein